MSKSLLNYNRFSLASSYAIALFFVSVLWLFIGICFLITEILAILLYRSKKPKSSSFQEGLVSITIVNLNSKNYIVDCLESIKKQKYPKVEIIIVDNNSTDGSLECIESFLSRCSIEAKIIKNKTNVGFSRAHNQGIRISRGEYFLPLNFDVLISERFILNMVEEMEADSRVGISSGKLLNIPQKSIIDTAGVFLKDLFCCDRGQGQADEGQYEKKEYIFGASGCAPFYRRNMLEDVRFRNEYFDETFNTYVEDVDLSWRSQIYDWKCLYNPRATGYHYRGATRVNNSKALTNYFIQGFRNRYLMILKNLLLVSFLRNFTSLMSAEIKFWTLNFSIKRSFYAKFIPGFIFLSPAVLIKRVSILQNAKVSSREIESALFVQDCQNFINKP
ncbi:MAG: glycosyltransferase [Candidatus Omnitrophica bacterium]|nr:glycosyltransferase [Candidatus Omnitrophota bacterium]